MTQNDDLARGRPAETTQPSLVDLAMRRPHLRRSAASAEQVERLLAAGLEVMRRNGTSRRPPVSEIVREAGLSNVAFYKHFPTRDDLVAAIIEAGAFRLVSYLDYQMNKRSSPEDKIAAWIEGFLSQASGPTAQATRAVLWNGTHLNDPSRHRVLSDGGPLADLLLAPLTELGRPDPAADAAMIFCAVSGRQRELLWLGREPDPAMVNHAINFCLASITRTS